MKNALCKKERVLEKAVINGTLWLRHKSISGMYTFYVVNKYGSDDFGGWLFEVYDSELEKLGIKHDNIQDLEPYINLIYENFDTCGCSSRGSLIDELSEFEDFLKYEELQIDFDYKELLTKELTEI